MRQPRADTWLPGLLSSRVSSLRGADGVDDTAVKYLLLAEFKLKKKEEEEKEREQERKLKEAQDKADLELAKRDPWWAQAPRRQEGEQGILFV